MTALLVVILGLLIGTSHLQSQTISINPIAATHYCAGDTMSVSFTASGQFGHLNAFTIQVSDEKGQFKTGFTNLASIKDTTPGLKTIRGVVPNTIWNGTHYRIRIQAAVPYSVTVDNGSDITIAGIPSFNLRSRGTMGVGIEAQFDASLYDNAVGDTVVVDFGADANPANFVDANNSGRAATTYATGGTKTVTMNIHTPGGCTWSKSQSVYVYDCRKPSIPRGAVILSNDTTVSKSNIVYWVNPGVTAIFTGYGDTVFAEPGAAITGNSGLAYMKIGSTFWTDHYGSSVIYAEGASVTSSPGKFDLSLSCPTLDFDYSQAPPNKAVPFAGAPSNLASAVIEISPNPTSGMLTLRDIPEEVQRVAVLNVLGVTMQRVDSPHATSLELDLSNLAPGTYYVRFETSSSVLTKKTSDGKEIAQSHAWNRQTVSGMAIYLAQRLRCS